MSALHVAPMTEILKTVVFSVSMVAIVMSTTWVVADSIASAF